MNSLKLIFILHLSLHCQIVSVFCVDSAKNFERKIPISPQLKEEDEPQSVADMKDLTSRLDEIYADLQKIKLSMFLNQNAEKDLKIFKCATALSKNNEESAIKFWDDLHAYLAPYDEAKNIASKLINRLNIQPEQDILPIIRFFQYMNVPQAYEILQKKLKDTGHFYDDHKIFILAENIRKICGTNQSSFTTLPQIIRDISSSVVVLKNKFNGGYLYYQSKPENFFTWFSPHKHRNNFNDLPEKTRAEWEFKMIGDKVQIVNNNSNKNVSTNPKMRFTVELVDDNEIRLRVDESHDHKLIGKYLVGKVRNRGEQYSLIEFKNITTTNRDHFIWKAEAQQLKNESISNIQFC